MKSKPAFDRFAERSSIASERPFRSFQHVENGQTHRAAENLGADQVPATLSLCTIGNRHPKKRQEVVTHIQLGDSYRSDPPALFHSCQLLAARKQGIGRLSQCGDIGG